MQEQNGRKNVVAALERKEPEFIPTFEWDINKKIVRDLTGGDDIFEAVCKLDIDGVVVRPDYSKEIIDTDLYIDEWGSKRKVTKESISVSIEYPIKDIKEHRSYRFPDPHRDGRFLTLEQAVRRFGGQKAVILNVRDIFSDIRDLIGYENALIALITEGRYFRELLDRVIEYNFTLVQLAAKKYGIDIVVTTDDIAGNRGLIFNPAVYFDFLSEKFHSVIQGFKKLGCYVIKHCDGDISAVIEDWIDSGIDCIDPVDPNAGMELGVFKERYGDRICLKGNVDCQGALVFGGPEDVEEEVKRCIAAAGKGGGYILSSSNMIHSGVKPENYKRMIDALRKYGKFPYRL